ncbi:hypothetical protein [Butyricicoccus pullicaecorum]|uniref:hypothetical protein n=1 Tax=Butyricicoccus pullicaecorum TaxID=501571 RepID=UPI003522C5BB
MYIYANKFNFATNEAGTELMLCFQQSSPDFKSEQSVDVTLDTVANIVMTPSFARELAENLLHACQLLQSENMESSKE